MSTPWPPLLPLAMVGTDRHMGALPAWPGDIGLLVAQAAGPERPTATGVLRIAAVLASCSLAGAQGMAWDRQLPSAAPPDTQPAVGSGPLLASTRWTVQQGPERLQHLLFDALAAAGLRLPDALLPQALELGRRCVALRGPLRAVLGARGRWLAMLREDWLHGAVVQPGSGASDARHWTEGSLAQRVAFLQQERGTDPQGARERLAAALPELPARERAELAAVLALGLGMGDEPLLDTLRTDRSNEVRQVALRLLLCLPGSAHGQRATARLLPLLRYERALLRRHWRIDAPQATGSDWKADGLDTERPQHASLGERGWWLYQLVRQVPLDWWTAHTGMDAPGLLHWAAGTDWQEALVRGWHDVLLQAREPAWCEALLAHWPDRILTDSRARILALLPLAAREQHWLRQLRANDLPLHVLAWELLAACPSGETLSQPFSVAMAEAVRGQSFSPAASQGAALRSQLADLCCVLHADALPTLARLQPPADATPSITATFELLAQTIVVRDTLQALTRSIP